MWRLIKPWSNFPHGPCVVFNLFWVCAHVVAGRNLHSPISCSSTAASEPSRGGRDSQQGARGYQGVSKVTKTVFRSRESENSRQISGLYPNLRMADDRFNAGILRISEMPSGPAACTIKTPIKDTYDASVLFTVKPWIRIAMSYKAQERIRRIVKLGVLCMTC